jgi:exopolyphosphatase/guanosine-5'-triphosphate,3'-diphosphate pyrophosphatase
LLRRDSREYGTSARFLRWAANLHEIGISIAHNGFHKHGAYIATYADMPGFSRKDQEYLSTLILGQRGKLEKLLPLEETQRAALFCLRMAVLLHRSRDDAPPPLFTLKRDENGFSADFQKNWLRANPLTSATLEEEAALWARVGRPFRIGR